MAMPERDARCQHKTEDDADGLDWIEPPVRLGDLNTPPNFVLIRRIKSTPRLELAYREDRKARRRAVVLPRLEPLQSGALASRVIDCPFIPTAYE